MIVLLYLFNSIFRSLSVHQKASELDEVQLKLGGRRVSLRSISEAVEVFDPERFQAIIEFLAIKVKRVRDVRQGAFHSVPHGYRRQRETTFKSIAEATFMGDKNGGSLLAWRPHTQFDID